MSEFFTPSPCVYFYGPESGPADRPPLGTADPPTGPEHGHDAGALTAATRTRRARDRADGGGADDSKLSIRNFHLTVESPGLPAHPTEYPGGELRRDVVDCRPAHGNVCAVEKRNEVTLLSALRTESCLWDEDEVDLHGWKVPFVTLTCHRFGLRSQVLGPNERKR